MKIRDLTRMDFQELPPAWPARSTGV